MKGICQNCKHAGQVFVVAGIQHLHCEHPHWRNLETEAPEKATGWDTLREITDTCGDFEAKKRPGAPRKRPEDLKKAVTMKLSPDVIEILETHPGSKNKTQFTEKAIRHLADNVLCRYRT